MTIHPDGTHDEAATFIYNQGGGLYERPDITKALKDFGYTRKISSKEAYQAFSPENIWRCDVVFNRSPPLGVVTIPRKQHIDVDEFGVEMKQ